MTINTSFKRMKNTRTKKRIFVVLLLSLAAAMGYWYYSQLEWEEKEIDLGYSKEAQRNNFLAAEIFLRKHGIPATTIKNLSLLDQPEWRGLELGAKDTVILINAHKTLTSERYDRLYEWVENGGTLITSTQNPFIGPHTDEEDLLLRDFGIIPAKDLTASDPSNPFDDIVDDTRKTEDDTKKITEPDASDSNEHEKEAGNATDGGLRSKEKKSTQDKKEKQKEKDIDRPENYYRCSLNKEPTEMRFDNEPAPLRFDFTWQDPFFYRDEFAAEYDSDEKISLDETHLLFFDVGAGSITVTSDNHIWSNRRIDCHDHAYALWSLVNPEGRVWFLINQDAPSLAAILWRSSPYAVLASALALFTWLWAKASRFGPIFIVNQQGRRSLAEHIHASAMLLWRKQQHPQLLTLLRAEILERLAQQHPHLQENSRSSQIQTLQQITGLAQSDIQQALFMDELHQPHAFANAIATLQIIRKHL